MTPAHSRPLRVRTCNRCARLFSTDGPYLRGFCPSCIALVVGCWAESRYRHVLTELAVTAAVRSGVAGLVTSLGAALERLASITRHAIYLRRAGDRFELAAPAPEAPPELPAGFAEVGGDCIGPVARFTLAEGDVRVGTASACHGWTVALPLRGDAEAIGLVLMAAASGMAIGNPDDLAYLSIVASAIGAGLARAHAV